jgi:hypothetical protein
LKSEALYLKHLLSFAFKNSVSQTPLIVKRGSFLVWKLYEMFMLSVCTFENFKSPLLFLSTFCLNPLQSKIAADLGDKSPYYNHQGI